MIRCFDDLWCATYFYAWCSLQRFPFKPINPPAFQEHWEHVEALQDAAEHDQPEKAEIAAQTWAFWVYREGGFRYRLFGVMIARKQMKTVERGRESRRIWYNLIEFRWIQCSFRLWCTPYVYAWCSLQRFPFKPTNPPACPNCPSRNTWRTFRMQRS